MISQHEAPTPTDADDLDGVWHALASPWRRRILDLLRDGPRTTGALAEGLGQSRHLLLQHLGVLREAGLVVTEPRGRTRINYLNAVPIRQIYERWVSTYEAAWAEALVGLKRNVEERTATAPRHEVKRVG